jgi:uncharacterized SAM-dependent methyltransferase
LNVLRRLNREFGYDFDIHDLRVEKHVESLYSQQVKLIDRFHEEIIHFDKGEMIYIEDGYNFTNEQVSQPY